MKISTASNMCTLSCALIMCTLVSAANTNTDDPNKPTPRPFDSSETTTEEKFTNWNIVPITTSTANGKYGSKPTLSTPPVTDLNDSDDDSDSDSGEFVTNNAIDNSTKPGNDFIPSDKRNSYTTEPIPTTNGTQLLAEPPSRTQPLTTTPIANGRYNSTTTPGTPSGTNLNDMQGDEANVSPSEDVIGNSQTPENKKYSSTKSIPANDDTQSKPKKSKTKWSNDPIPFIWLTTDRPTRYYRPTEWIKPKRNCKCAFDKQHSKHCKKNEKETTTTKVWGRFAEYKQWDQQRHMSETTTNNVQGQLEESKKWKIQQKVLEMESNRFNTILDVLNRR